MCLRRECREQAQRQGFAAVLQLPRLPVKQRAAAQLRHMSAAQPGLPLTAGCPETPLPDALQADIMNHWFTRYEKCAHHMKLWRLRSWHRSNGQRGRQCISEMQVPLHVAVPLMATLAIRWTALLLLRCRP